MKKLTLSFVLISIAFYSFGQDPNILLNLNLPANGVKIKANFPGYTGGWARGFTISNENADPHFGIGALGFTTNGVSSFDRGWIGKSFEQAFMNFLPNGNIGVGTEYPENIENWSRVFEVHGNEHAKSLVSSNQVISGLWAHDYGFYGAPSGGIVGTYSNHPFSIITNSSSKITIMPDGNVGLGTITPRSMLDISKPLNGGKLGVVLGRLADGDGTGEGTFLGVRGYNASYNTPEPFSSKSFALEHSFYGKINSSINFYRGGDVVGGEISFNTNSNIERMRIDGLGNVGLGTTTPRSILDISKPLNGGKLGAVLGRLEEGDGTGEGTFLGVRGYNASYNTPEPFSSKSFALEHSFYGKINSSINFYRGGDVIGGEISFNTNSNIERMRIDGLGNVGIGTSIPKKN